MMSKALELFVCVYISVCVRVFVCFVSTQCVSVCPSVSLVNPPRSLHHPGDGIIIEAQGGTGGGGGGLVGRKMRVRLWILLLPNVWPRAKPLDSMTPIF